MCLGSSFRCYSHPGRCSCRICRSHCSYYGCRNCRSSRNCGSCRSYRSFIPCSRCSMLFYGLHCVDCNVWNALCGTPSDGFVLQRLELSFKTSHNFLFPLMIWPRKVAAIGFWTGWSRILEEHGRERCANGKKLAFGRNWHCGRVIPSLAAGREFGLAER